jgi:hypothetical protein
MSLSSPRKSASELAIRHHHAGRSAPDSAGEEPLKAKRIARPSHWKHVAHSTPASPIAEADDSPLPAAPATSSNAALTTTAWREDPAFVLRLLAIVALLNMLLFFSFPYGLRDASQMSETYTPITSNLILPEPKVGNAAKLTLYAPAPRTASELRPAAPAAAAPAEADASLDEPRWLRSSDSE